MHVPRISKKIDSISSLRKKGFRIVEETDTLKTHPEKSSASMDRSSPLTNDARRYSEGGLHRETHRDDALLIKDEAITQYSPAQINLNTSSGVLSWRRAL